MKPLFYLVSAVLLFTVSSLAQFPGISYNQWNDFEQCTNAAAPTTACLNSSNHVATGSWSVTNGASTLTIQSTAQGTETGTTGTHGFQYSGNPSTQSNWISYCFDATCTYSTSHATMSIGFFYNTGTCSVGFQECSHTVNFSNNAFGDLTRISDERDAVNNTRELRISPCNGGTTSCEVAVADNTKYWITMKYVQNGTTSLSVYTPAYVLVGSATWAANINSPVTNINFGSDLGALNATFTHRIDDVIMDWTTATYPLLPNAGAAATYISQAGGSVSCGADGTQSTTAIGSVTWTAGNTYKICGTITSAVTVGASGSAGNLITLQWESNGLISKCSTTGALNLGGRSFILVDMANTSPSITCPSNGSPGGVQAIGIGDSGSGFSNVEIRNGTIGPLYAFSGTGSDGTGSQGIAWFGGTGNHIHNLTIKSTNTGVYAVNGNGISSTNEIDHITCPDNGTPGEGTVGRCIEDANGDNSAFTDSNTKIHDNDITHGNVWSTSAGCATHLEDIQTFNQGNGGNDKISGMLIYNNYIHGKFGNCTSTAIAIYEGGSTCAAGSTWSGKIFNNLIVQTNLSAPSFDGFIFTQNCEHTLEIYNNTIDGGSNTQGMCIELEDNPNTFTVKNNVCMNSQAMIVNLLGTPTITTDFNDYYNVGVSGSNGWYWRGVEKTTLAAWRTASGGDANAFTTIPGLNSDYTVTGAGSAVHLAGSNLTALGVVPLDTGSPVTFGSAGACGTGCVGRPSGATAWDVGAYQYSAAGLTATSTTLTSSVNPTTFGQSTTFTATVTPSAASGTVNFLDGVTQIGTGTLSGGVATFASTALTVATHSITAVYVGNGTYSGSTSGAVSQVVNAAATSTETGSGQLTGQWNIFQAIQTASNGYDFSAALPTKYVNPWAPEGGVPYGSLNPDVTIVLGTSLNKGPNCHTETNGACSGTVAYTADILGLRDSGGNWRDNADNTTANQVPHFTDKSWLVQVPHGTNLHCTTTQPIPACWMAPGKLNGIAEPNKWLVVESDQDSLLPQDKMVCGRGIPGVTPGAARNPGCDGHLINADGSQGPNDLPKLFTVTQDGATAIGQGTMMFDIDANGCCATGTQADSNIQTVGGGAWVTRYGAGIGDPNAIPNPWVTGHAYVTSQTLLSNSYVSDGGQNYVCILAHTSGASTEPGVGASWATYWKRLVMTITQNLAPTGTQMDMAVDGGSYWDWMAAISRPLLNNNPTGTTNVNLSFKVKIDQPTIPQALEFGTRVVVGGWDSNFSMEIDYSRGGVLQILDQNSLWVDAGYTVGKFTANTWYPMLLEYQYNATTRKFSYIAVSIAGTRYPIPSNLQNLNMSSSTWSDGLNIQFQEDVAQAGGAFTLSFDNVQYVSPGQQPARGFYANHIAVYSAEQTMASGAFQSKAAVKASHLVTVENTTTNIIIKRNYIHGHDMGDTGQPTDPCGYSGGVPVAGQGWTFTGTVAIVGTQVTLTTGNGFGMTFVPGATMNLTGGVLVNAPYIIAGSFNHNLSNTVLNLTTAPGDGAYTYTLTNPPAKWAHGCGDDAQVAISLNGSGTSDGAGSSVEGTGSVIQHSYIEKIHWFANESHAASFGFSDGPIMIDDTNIEGGSASLFSGGAPVDTRGGPCHNAEFTRNVISKDFNWRYISAGAGNSPAPPWGDGPLDGNSSHDDQVLNYAIKNNFELKLCDGVLVNGNRIMGNWADAQPGPSVLLNVRTCSGGEICGIFDPVTGRPLTFIRNVTISENWISDSPEIFEFSPHAGGPGNGGGVSDPLEKVDIQGNVVSNMVDSDTTHGGQWGNPGNDWFLFQNNGNTWDNCIVKRNWDGAHSGVAWAHCQIGTIDNSGAHLQVSKVTKVGSTVTVQFGGRVDPYLGGTVVISVQDRVKSTTYNAGDKITPLSGNAGHFVFSASGGKTSTAATFDFSTCQTIGQACPVDGTTTWTNAAASLGYEGSFTLATGLIGGVAAPPCTEDKYLTPLQSSQYNTPYATQPQPCVRANGTFSDSFSYTQTSGSGDPSCASVAACATGFIVSFPTWAYSITDIRPTDYVWTTNCTDASYATGVPTYTGPDPLACDGTVCSPSNNEVSLDVYWHTGTGAGFPDDATGTNKCTISNAGGFTKSFTFRRNTVLMSGSGSITAFNYGNQFVNSNISENIFTGTGAKNTVICNSESGDGDLALVCWDQKSLHFFGNVLTGKGADPYGWGVYPASMASTNPHFFPATVTCPGANATATCVGLTGFMSGKAFPTTPCDVSKAPFDCPLVSAPYSTNLTLAMIKMHSSQTNWPNAGANTDAIQDAMTRSKYPCPVGRNCGAHGPYQK